MHMCYCLFLCCAYTHKCNAATPSVPLLRQQWSGSASGTPTPNQIQHTVWYPLCYDD